jgi:glycosyltransferase involved in cell wall biosynthesis
MPLISIITAAHESSAAFISETIRSVEALEFPDDWSLEWIVQEDGDSPVLAEQFAGREIIKYAANGAQLGIARTRNLALTRAAGVLVQVLDLDDLLLPGVFTTLVPLFDEHRIQWAIGQADDLMPDGTRKKFRTPVPFGILKAGQVNMWAADDGGNWPVHGASLLMRTTALRALGGWAGLPHDEDIPMFAALSELADGYHHDSLTWLYRQHPGQVTRTRQTDWSLQCRRSALQRVAAVRRSGLRFGPAPLGFTDDTDPTTRVEVRDAFKRQLPPE